MFVLIGLSAFFSGSETAFFSLTRDELRKFQVGSKLQKRTARLLRCSDRLLTAILFWNLIINLTYFAISVVTSRKLINEGYSLIAGGVSVGGVITIILLGEVFPKSLAVLFRKSIAPLAVVPIDAAVRVLDPLMPTLSATTRVLRRTFWPHIEREAILDADDLERAIEVASHSRELAQLERQILHNILDLSEITAEEVMRPRGSYPAFPAPIHMDLLRSSPPTIPYIMVMKEGSDDIESAIPLASFSLLPEKHLEEAGEPVVHVPWCANLANVLALLRQKFRSIASVVNEYGETIGIVTYEDVIETILEEQPSRAKRVLQREPVLEVVSGRYHVDGITTLRYLSQRLDLDFEIDADNVTTVTGLIFEQLERLPQIGDVCEWRDFQLRVIESNRRGRVRVMMERKPPEEIQVTEAASGEQQKGDHQSSGHNSGAAPEGGGPS